MQRNAPAERLLTTAEGDLFHAELGSFQEWHRWVYGPLEDQMSQLFSCLVQPGDRCVEFGAGIGLHAVRLAKLTGPAGEVIAVEPDREMALRAARNLALNGLANARVISAAAFDASGAAVADPSSPTEQVPVITIDEACSGPVALMKIDAGGGEAAVFDGAAATIERDSPAIVFECAPELLADHAQGLVGRLAQAGYLLYRITSGRNRLTGRCSLRLDPIYAQPKTDSRLLAVSEDDAPRIISLVASRDGRI
jgi:FkbM family methyltransferase